MLKKKIKKMFMLQNTSKIMNSYHDTKNLYTITLCVYFQA